MRKRVSIFIDGGNFYHLALKKLGVREENFDFEKFALYLAQGRTIVGKHYYVGTVRERMGDIRSREAMSRQAKLFTRLVKDGWDVHTSKLRHRTEDITIDQRVADWKKLRSLGIEKISFERSREKGIDVQIATDLLLQALDDSYDVAILVSSDADLIPAIVGVRNRLKKYVEYVGFSIPERGPHLATQPLFSMSPQTNAVCIAHEDTLKKFLF